MSEIIRDPRGRFVKGCSGNPKGAAINQFRYLKKMGAAVTASDWRAVIDKALEQAKRGDARAREWLSEYLMGKPPQQVDIDASDGLIQFIVRYAPDRDDGLSDNTTETA